MPVLRVQSVGCCDHDDSAGLEFEIECAKCLGPVGGQNVLEDLGCDYQIERFVIYPGEIIVFIDEKIFAVIPISQVLQIRPGKLEELLVYFCTYDMSCAAVEKEGIQLAQAAPEIEHREITQLRAESFNHAPRPFVEHIAAEPFSDEVKEALGIPLDQLFDKFLAEGQVDVTFFAYAGIPGGFMRVGPLCMKPSERTEILYFKFKRHGIQYKGKG